MKRNIKSLTMIFFILSGLIFTAVLAAPGEDLSKRVELSEFLFTDENGEPIYELPQSGTIMASCDLKRTEVGEGAQQYVFALMVYKGGKLDSLETNKGTIQKSDGTKQLFVSTVLTPTEETVTVRTVLLSDFLTMTPLAPPANFGSSEVRVNQIKIGNYPITLLDNVFDYNINLLLRESEIPANIHVTPRDASCKISITNITGNEGIATVEITSHDLSESAVYQINLKITQVTDTSLKEIRIDGVPYSQFSPDVFDYIVKTPLGAFNIPAVECETVSDTAISTITAATALPGTTAIVVQSADGETQEYKITFAKTINLASNYFAVKQYYTTTFVPEPIPSLVYRAYPNNGGRVANEDYTGLTSYTLLNFDSSNITDENVNITDVALNFKAMSGYSDGQYIEILRSVDTDWVTNPSAYAVQYMFPQIGEEGILNKEDCLIEFGDTVGNTENLYKNKTIPLKTDGFADFNSLNLIYRARYEEASSSARIFLWIGRNGSNIDIPTLTVTYY